LFAINRAEFALLVRPLVPDGHAVFLEVAGVGFAAQEPQQFVDDRAQVEFLGGQAGKALAQVVARLAAEDRKRAGAGAVRAVFAVFQNIPHQVEVGFHGADQATCRPRPARKKGMGNQVCWNLDVFRVMRHQFRKTPEINHGNSRNRAGHPAKQGRGVWTTTPKAPFTTPSA
jgi:hypothetical protein